MDVKMDVKKDVNGFSIHAGFTVSDSSEKPAALHALCQSVVSPMEVPLIHRPAAIFRAIN